MSLEIINDANGTIISLFGVFLSLFLLYLWLESRPIAKLGNKIPGQYPLPLIGNALEVLGLYNDELLKTAMKLADVYGTVVRFWIGPQLVVFLRAAEDIEVILNSREHIQKSPEYKYFEPFLGDGLLISNGEKWHKQRQIIAPAFHQNVLKTFFDDFNRNSQELVKTLEKEVGKEFDVHKYLGSVTVNILLETAMATKKNYETNERISYATAIIKLCDILHKRQILLHLRPDAFFKFTNMKKEQDSLVAIAREFTEKVFKFKKETFTKNLNENENSKENIKISSINDKKMPNINGFRDDLDAQDENDIGEKRRLPLLEQLIEKGNHGEISDQEIKDQVDTIMFAGHDTTAAGSGFVLCLLGVYQNIQNKVYEEIQEIFRDSDRPATFADTTEMKYLERVILETFRLYPPVPGIARKLNKDTKLVTNGYVLPAGCTVVIGTFKLHRDPENFPNPEVFDPDNFLPEKTSTRHYYSYIPFSAGPRSCVGRKYAMLKLKVLISTILRKYKIISHIQEKDFKLRIDIILKREDNFRIEIVPRVNG